MNASQNTPAMDITALRSGETIRVGDLTITAVPDVGAGDPLLRLTRGDMSSTFTLDELELELEALIAAQDPSRG